MQSIYTTLSSTGAREAEEAARAAAEAEAKQKLLDEFENNAKMLKNLEDNYAKAMAELEAEKESASIQRREMGKLASEKSDLESQVRQLDDSLACETEKRTELESRGKKLEDEISVLSKDVADLENKYNRLLSDNGNKDNQIQNFKNEVECLNDNNARLSQEKKQLEEQNNNFQNQLSEVENNLKNVESSKKKLEEALESAENNYAAERREKLQGDNHRRKLETQLGLAQSTIEKCEAINSDQEAVIKRKELDVNRLSQELNDERDSVLNVQKKVKQLQYHLSESEELNSEIKGLKSRSDKHAEELAHEIKDLQSEVNEANAGELRATELRKKAEYELNNLRREMSENNKRNELNFSQLKKKHDDTINEMSRQIETLIRAKSKLEKERLSLIAGNDKGRGPVGFLDKDEIFQIEMNKQSALKQRFQKE